MFNSPPIAENDFCRNKLIMICMILSLSNVAFPQEVTTRIKLNQLGFYPNAPKVAVVTAKAPGDHFYITSDNLRDTFFAGKLSGEKQSSNSSTKTRIADFSAFSTKGTFVVLVPGIGHSYIFQIDNKVFHKAAVASLKGFYYQRASMPLEEKYAGKWHRPAGQPDTVVHIHPSAATASRPEGTIISSPGGWYDAGDYNKYIVNSGITMGTLLSAYEDFPDYFKSINSNIPESADDIPDILNEIIYNLRWMLNMQDPHDGGVYNNFPVDIAAKQFNPDVIIGVNVASKVYEQYPYDNDEKLISRSLLLLLLDTSL